MKEKVNKEESSPLFLVALTSIIMGAMLGGVLHKTFGKNQFSQEEVDEAVRRGKADVIYLKDMCEYVGTKMKRATSIKNGDTCVVQLNDDKYLQLNEDEVDRTIDILQIIKK